MASLNRVDLIGNLGADPEKRFLPDGKPTATIRVATTDVWKDRDTGERKERTEWHRIVFFGRLAEVACDYLRKGSSVYVEGKLRTRKWTDEQNTERYSTEIIANGMKLLDKKDSGQGSSTLDSDQAEDFGNFEDEEFATNH